MGNFPLRAGGWGGNRAIKTHFPALFLVDEITQAGFFLLIWFGLLGGKLSRPDTYLGKSRKSRVWGQREGHVSSHEAHLASVSAWTKEKEATRRLTLPGTAEPQNLVALSEKAQQSQAEAGRVFYSTGTESLKGLGT